MSQPVKVTLPVKGMHCASCASVIQRELQKTPGVYEARSSYGTEEATITYNSSQTTLHELNARLKKVGYSLDITGSITNQSDNTPRSDITRATEVGQISAMWAMPIAIIVFLAMVWEMLAEQWSIIPGWPISEEVWMVVLWLLATLIFASIGRSYLRAIYSFVSARRANMDTLVGIGTLAAYVFSSVSLFFPNVLLSRGITPTSYFDVTIIVIAFVTYGKWLEAHSKQRTGKALHALMELQVSTAWVKRGDAFVELDVSAVAVGDLIQLKPGSKVPVDGVVKDGSSSINQAMLTGEALPIEKGKGDLVFAGTLNTDGVLYVEARSVGDATVLAHIVSMVKDAQNSKAPIERLADTVAGVFVPVIMVTAVLTLLTWMVIGSSFMGLSQGFAIGLTTSIAVLVIACPCALGLATPTALIVAVGQAAKRGILIKNAESLEMLHRVTTVIFDKTGTLTTGQTVVAVIETYTTLSEAKVWQLLLSLELLSEHPLAKAVVQYAHAHDIQGLPVKHFSAVPGKGVKGSIAGQEYAIGSLKWASQSGLKVPKSELPGSALVLFTKDEVVAVITVQDTLKESSQESITLLKQLGIKVIMLSGDNEISARHFAQQVGIDHVVAEVSPADKLAVIRTHQQKGEVVAMVGDGINDAPALAAADVGIAMSEGTDVAIATSQVTLLQGDLRKVAESIELSKRSFAVIKQNLWWAFGYNVVSLPLAAGLLYPVWGILLSPAIAGMAMAFSSISVVLNSLRLQYMLQEKK